jgi:cytochrome c-type biogenesis protein CcmE
MSSKKIIIFIAALVLLVFSILLISDDLFSPYVSFETAREKAGKNVQVIGKRIADSPVVHNDQGFTFTLTEEEGDKITAFHKGVKPLNFEHADQVVLIGKYSAEKQLFEADKVLTKCPSKYEKENN